MRKKGCWLLILVWQKCFSLASVWLSKQTLVRRKCMYHPMKGHIKKREKQRIWTVLIHSKSAYQLFTAPPSFTLHENCGPTSHQKENGLHSQWTFYRLFFASLLGKMSNKVGPKWPNMAFETGVQSAEELIQKISALHPIYSFLLNRSHGWNSSNCCAFWKTMVWIILTCGINRKPWS